jgi:hypothetical protein
MDTGFGGNAPLANFSIGLTLKEVELRFPLGQSRWVNHAHPAAGYSPGIEPQEYFKPG